MDDNVPTTSDALARQEYMTSGLGDKFAGRRKFTCCHQCGGVDGMQAIDRMLAEVAPPRGNWHIVLGDNECLYYPCPHCNPDSVIPSIYISINDARQWLDADDPMTPDYAALAAEPVAATAGEDSRESAGL